MVCLSPTESKFTYLNIESMAENQAYYVFSKSNVYGLLKSLPLQKKIELITKTNEEHKNSLRQVILTELADEHKIFSQHNWTGKWSKNELKQSLPCLQQVLDGEYSNSESQEWIKDLLIQFYTFVNRIPTTTDHIFAKRRRSLLASAVKEKIDVFFKEKLELDHASWKKERNEARKDAKALKRKDLSRLYCSQNNSKLPQYNLSCKTNRVLDKDDLDGVYSSPQLSTVAEGRHYFENQKQRLQALKSLESGNTNSAIANPVGVATLLKSDSGR